MLGKVCTVDGCGNEQLKNRAICREHKTAQERERRAAQRRASAQPTGLAALLAQVDAVDPTLRATFAVHIQMIADIDATPQVRQTGVHLRERRMAADSIAKAIEARAAEGRSMQQRVEAVERLVEWLGPLYTPDD